MSYCNGHPDLTVTLYEKLNHTKCLKKINLKNIVLELYLTQQVGVWTFYANTTAGI